MSLYSEVFDEDIAIANALEKQKSIQSNSSIENASTVRNTNESRYRPRADSYGNISITPIKPVQQNLQYARPIREWLKDNQGYKPRQLPINIDDEEVNYIGKGHYGNVYRYKNCYAFKTLSQQVLTRNYQSE